MIGKKSLGLHVANVQEGLAVNGPKNERDGILWMYLSISICDSVPFLLYIYIHIIYVYILYIYIYILYIYIYNMYIYIYTYFNTYIYIYIAFYTASYAYIPGKS